MTGVQLWILELQVDRSTIVTTWWYLSQQTRIRTIGYEYVELDQACNLLKSFFLNAVYETDREINILNKMYWATTDLFGNN
jgi:hypothetical protein